MELGGKQFSKKELIIAGGQLILVSGNNFFLYFSETPASDIFFPSSGKDVSRTFFIPANGNGF